MSIARGDHVKTIDHLLALREADLRFADERDRRYAEVAAARAEALKIKDEADREALRLQRETQTYKDEKANELRAQIEQERGKYLSVEVYNDRHEELIRRIAAIEQEGARAGGRTEGIGVSRATLVTAVTMAVLVIGMIIAVMNLLTGQ